MKKWESKSEKVREHKNMIDWKCNNEREQVQDVCEVGPSFLKIQKIN